MRRVWHAACFVCGMTRTRPLSPIRPLLLALFALLLAAALTDNRALAAAQAPETARFRDTCATAVATAEREHAIPDKLLTAISHAESGRWDDDEQATIAWPWTVTAEGTGHYLPSRAAAIAKVKELQRRGVINIDVGCMQVNLRYHPDAFDDIAAAFDPATNAAYAGSFLAALKRETGSWGAAAARYHSATREFAVPYRAKVMRLWHAAKAETATAPAAASAATAKAAAAAEPDAAAEKRRAAAEAHRQAIIAAYLARRAARAAAEQSQRLATAD